jgi:hypothetical protein
MYYLSDVAQFARKKGSKDKKKRQSKLNKFLKGELNTKTGKRNVTLREPVIKRTVVGAATGAVVGTAGLTGLALAQGMSQAKKQNVKLQISPKDMKDLVVKAGKHIAPKAAVAGAGLGVALGVSKYLSRRKEIKQYNAGKHMVNKYEIKRPK